jgi:hypothetical protein
MLNAVEPDPVISRETAKAQRLVVLIDLDATAADAASERELMETLRGLKSTRVHVLLVSGRGREELEPLRTQIPGALWAPDHGRWRNDYDRWHHVDVPPLEARASLATWLDGLLPGATFLSFADGSIDPCAVRSALAWVATVRLGTDHHSPAASHERPDRSDV